MLFCSNKVILYCQVNPV